MLFCFGIRIKSGPKQIVTVFYIDFVLFCFLLQVRDVQQVIKLTKKNLDELNRQFGNCPHPPSMYMEVGSHLFCTENILRLRRWSVERFRFHNQEGKKAP